MRIITQYGENTVFSEITDDYIVDTVKITIVLKLLTMTMIIIISS